MSTLLICKLREGVGNENPRGGENRGEWWGDRPVNHSAGFIIEYLRENGWCPTTGKRATGQSERKEGEDSSINLDQKVDLFSAIFQNLSSQRKRFSEIRGNKPHADQIVPFIVRFTMKDVFLNILENLICVVLE